MPNFSPFLWMDLDDELFLVLWCDTICDDEAFHTNMSYFAVKMVDTQELFDCMQNSLSRIGIKSLTADYCKLMVALVKTVQVLIILLLAEGRVL